MMQQENQFRHWQYDHHIDDIVWLAIDTPDSSVNTLSSDALKELKIILERLKLNPPKGLVFYSKKKSGFAAGADIHSFQAFSNQQQILDFVREGQDIFEELAHLPFPTVCYMNGLNLGGGMELALACQIRIAEEDVKTKIGLPEAKLGIFPAWGGLRRLPKLIGSLAALPLMLQGKIIDAKTAKALGIVDFVVPKRQWMSACQDCIEKKVIVKHATWVPRLSNQILLKPVIAKIIERQLRKKVIREHYPAPYAMLKLWRKEPPEFSQARDAEINTIRELVFEHPTAKNLLRVFSLQELLKHTESDEHFKVKHVHVIGAGTMGGDIAAWCALRGIRVTLHDRTADLLKNAVKRAYQLFQKKLKQPRLIQAAMDRLILDVEGCGVKKADVIIEAIFEDLSAKQKLWAEVEAQAKPDALFATNTSSIPLQQIASVMKNSSRLIGIHFFNPVALMQLVEVVHSEDTHDDTIKKTVLFVRQIDKLPLKVKSSPGFLVNRLLMPYLMEAMRLVEEGVPPYLIDKAAENFGMPMGPIELADTVGLDICLAVADNLTKAYGGTVPVKLQELVKEGHLGRKTQKGFYDYYKGKPNKTHESVPTSGEADICDRLIMAMLGEAVTCLQEHIVESSDHLDAGIIFGAGFAPFRGGLIHYAQTIGLSGLQELVKRLEQQYGERFFKNSDWTRLITNV